MKLASRLDKIDSSGIRKVFDLAATLENPINLSIGQPDFDIPDSIKSAAIKNINIGNNKYTQTQGLARLVSKIQQKLEVKNNIKVNSKSIIITSGVSGGLLLSLMTIINPGDEVIISDPYFVMYKHLIKLIGGIPVYLDTYPYFKIDLNKLKNCISSKTKLLILNSPSNPTGQIISEKTTRNIADIAEQHNLMILSDEIYEDYNYTDSYFSIGSIYHNTITLNGYSKNYAMLGWRIGYAAGPKEIIQGMAKIQQYSFVCAPSISQYALADIDEYPDISNYIAEYKKRRDYLVENLSDCFEIAVPQGSFYMFVKVPAGFTGTSFCEICIKNNLLVIPGNIFSEKDTHFRLTFTVGIDKLEKAVKILRNLKKSG